MNLASVVGPHPDGAIALRAEPDREITYGQLRDDVARLRGGLAARGVRRGDRVAIVLPNTPDFVAVYLAILGVGAVAVPLNPLSPQPELQRELAAVEAGTVVDEAVVGELRTAEQQQQPPVVDLDPDDLAVLVFTSGTGGPPRPAMLSHANLLANIDQILSVPEAQTAQDRVLGVLPLFHIYGLNAVLGTALAAGAAVVLAERFDAALTLDLIRRAEVTVVPGVPTMWSAWADLEIGGAEAFSGVRLATSGAAPLDPTVRRRLRERFGVKVVEGYGLTEASPAVTSGLGVDAPDGSIGRPLAHVSMRLVDADEADVLVGDPGEIWVRGPNVFTGYWQDQEATAAALTPDGWLRTGDIAVVDDDGFLFVVDRVKDIVIVSGFNVYPAEVEEVIAAHPQVAEAAVVGVPDPRTGEAVAAYVVPVDGAQLDQDEIVAYCGDNLAHYKCPIEVTIVAELPHTPAGKVLRRAVG